MSPSSTATTTNLAESSFPAALWGRRLGIGFLALVVAVDLAGGLGVHTVTRSAAGAGYRLTLSYPGIARPGLDVPWRVTVEHPGGFSGPITLALTGDYLTIFETQGFHPNPTSETRDGNDLLMTFAPPPGDTFVLDYDAYIQPASEHGADGTLALHVHGRAVASLAFGTFLWP
ncbi:hypothetical protein GCM10028801_39750 [Nocardioides maradonensis]